MGIFLFLFPAKGGTVTLSEGAEVSILTCGPGKMIHAIYGHTAIRVNDPAQRLDIVFNYGVFDFSKSHFVYRFARGQTDYMLAPEHFSEFYGSYQQRGRAICEQVLDLTMAGKQKLWNFLVENAKPENRVYRYNFFLDNCSSRVRDVLEKQTAEAVEFPGDGEHMTFRQHIGRYQKVVPWTDFGIDLALGSPADQVATPYQEMFLPDYLMKHVGRATIKTAGGWKPLVRETRVLYEPQHKRTDTDALVTPVSVFSVLLVVVILISIGQYRKRTKNDLVDYALLFLTGLTGVAALWLMTWSEHPAVQSNYNVLWAVPFNLVFMAAWMVRRWRRALRWYWPVLSVWLILFLAAGFLVPQRFHPAVYPIVLMLLCRGILHTLQKNSFIFVLNRRPI